MSIPRHRISFGAWRQALQRFVSVIPHTRDLGVQVARVGIDGVTLEAPWHDDLAGDSCRKLVHSGALSVLIDTACGSAVLPALPAPEVCPTLDLHIDHYRPARSGEAITVRAWAVAVTASVVFTEALAWQGDGRIVARGVGSFLRLGSRNTPPGFAEAMFEGIDTRHDDDVMAPLGGHDACQAGRPEGDGGQGLGSHRASGPPRRAVSLERLNAGRVSGDIGEWLDQIPYARRLGVGLESDDEGRRFVLEPRDGNVGNFLLPALHGGVLAAFMETAAHLEVLLALKTPRLPCLVNVSIDYLRSAAVAPTYARCRLVREGRRIANLQVSAWQEDESLAVTTARLNFVLADAAQDEPDTETAAGA